MTCCYNFIYLTYIKIWAVLEFAQRWVARILVMCEI
jgi:hypothetical protein